MPIFAMKSLSQSCSLENAAAAYRTARRAGQYRVSGEAIYFPAFPGTRYLPFAALSRARSKPVSMNVTGCCGATLPMVCLRAFYDGEFYQDFMFENLKEADRLLDAVQAARPELDVERLTSDVKAI